MASSFDVVVSPGKVFSIEVHRRRGSEFIDGVVQIIVSRLSYHFPPDRPGSRDEILCWWWRVVTARNSTPIKMFVYCVVVMFAGIVCSICFTEIIIGEYFFPVFSYRMRDRPLSITAHEFATTGFHPSTVATSTGLANATGSKTLF